MAKVFTTIDDIVLDFELYMFSKQGGILTLGEFPAIAQNRWEWIVDNWGIFSQRFLDTAQGDETQEKDLEDLQREVQSFRLGNRLNPFSNRNKFNKFRKFLAQIPLAEVQLSPAEKTLKDRELLRISQFSEPDFRNMLALIRREGVIRAQEMGLGDDSANAILGITSQPKKRNPTIQELALIADMNELGKMIEGAIFDFQTASRTAPNLLEIAVRNQTAASQFPIQTAYISGTPAPFEISLEHMARKYLGSTQNWFELVTVNNLKPPFLDESGTKLSLLAPPAVNNLIISDTVREKLAPGVSISIGSSRHREESRIIERLIPNEDGTLTLYLSGNQDLNKFKPSENGFVRVYEPHTVRQGSFIIIPRTTPGTQLTARKTPESDVIRRLELAFINFGVDIMRDPDTRDLVLSPSGNFQPAVGFTAVRQTVLNTLRIKQGELPFHPNYGVNFNIGDIWFGTPDEAVLFSTLIFSALARNRKIKNVRINKINTTSNSLSIQLLVTIDGFNSPIPLSFIA